MQDETETRPRKLEKPVRERPELEREELVTYTDESGGGTNPSGGGPVPNPGE
jgi:hypothetical protein